MQCGRENITGQQNHYPPGNHFYKVLFPGHNHLLTTGTDDPSLARARVIINVSGF